MEQEWDELSGKVTHYQGDIIHFKVLDQGFQHKLEYSDEEKIRIVVLDASRLKTRWGLLSDEKLNEILKHRNITVHVAGRDEDGTILARVEL